MLGFTIRCPPTRDCRCCPFHGPLLQVQSDACAGSTALCFQSSCSCQGEAAVSKHVLLIVFPQTLSWPVLVSTTFCPFTGPSYARHFCKDHLLVTSPAARSK